VHAQDRIDDAVHDHATCACRPVVSERRADVLDLDPLTARICRRRGITHAKLINIGKSDLDARLR